MKILVQESEYFANVMDGLKEEIMNGIAGIEADSVFSLAKRVDENFRKAATTFFVYTIVKGDTLEVRANSNGDCLISVIVTSDTGSSCCFAPIVENTDICSKCKEHCEEVGAEP